MFGFHYLKCSVWLRYIGITTNKEAFMANLTRYEENNFEAYVDNEGNVFTTVNGYVRLSGISERTIRRRISNGGTFSPKMAEIPTAQGLRMAALLSEDVVTDWLFEDNPAVFKQMAKAGVRLFLKLTAGYNPQAEQKQKMLAGWKTSRLTLSDVEPAYQAWCKQRKYSASHTTNYIYTLVCELRADELRQLELIDGCPNIAANHIPTEQELETITRVKLRLTKFKRAFGSYKEAVSTALDNF